MSTCHQGWIDQNELSFDLGGDVVAVYSFTTKDEEDFFSSHKSIDNLDDIEKLLNSDIQFSLLTFKGGYEQLNSREDISIYTEAKSITNEMFSFIRRVKSFQNKFCPILNYTTEVEYSDAMCGDYQYYIFKIEIDKRFWWDANFAKQIFTIST